MSTAVEIVDQTTGCKSGWTHLFSKEWEGTIQGCYYANKASDIDDYKQYRRSKKQNDKCDNPIDQTPALN